MLDEFFASIKQFFQDRVASPAIRTFVISWAIVNYRLVFTLFGGGTYEAKFDYIRLVLYPTVEDKLLWGFAVPATAALALIYLFPFFDRRIYVTWLTNQRRLRTLRAKVEDEAIVPEEEAFRIRARNSELEKKLQESVQEASKLRKMLQDNADAEFLSSGEKEELLKEIETLRNSVESRSQESELESSSEAIANSSSLFSTDEMSHAASVVLRTLSSIHPEWCGLSKLIAVGKEDDVSGLRTTYAAEQLEEEKYLQYVDGSDGVRYYALTRAGMELCIRLGLDK